MFLRKTMKKSRFPQSFWIVRIKNFQKITLIINLKQKITLKFLILKLKFGEKFQKFWSATGKSFGFLRKYLPLNRVRNYGASYKFLDHIKHIQISQMHLPTTSCTLLFIISVKSVLKVHFYS